MFNTGLNIYSSSEGVSVLQFDFPTTEAFLSFYEEGSDKPEYPSEEEIEELAKSRGYEPIPKPMYFWIYPTSISSGHATRISRFLGVRSDLGGDGARLYGLLEPSPIKVPQPSSHESPFGRYISQPFEHKGHSFDAIAPTKQGHGAGLYGACVNANGDGSMFAPPMGMLNVLNHFLDEVGNSARFYQGEKLSGGPEVDEKPRRKGRTMVRGETETLFKASLDKGHPVITSCDIYVPGKSPTLWAFSGRSRLLS